MISARKILQIHRYIAHSLEQEPLTPFRIRGVLQILDWITLLVTQDQRGLRSLYFFQVSRAVLSHYLGAAISPL